MKFDENVYHEQDPEVKQVTCDGKWYTRRETVYSKNQFKRSWSKLGEIFGKMSFVDFQIFEIIIIIIFYQINLRWRKIALVIIIILYS